jgi:hypothetical protein
MFRSIVRTTGWAVIVATLMLGRRARAEEAPVVVDVKPAATELDPAQVRRLLAKELHGEVVSPDDPRASNARGTISIDIDREHAQLFVSYIAREQPIVRRLPLAGDQDALRNAAVSIAGNLARDEAPELLAELRKPKPEPRDATKMDSAESAAQPGAEEARALRAREAERDAARMQATLDYYASSDRSSRHWTGAAWLATSVAATAVGIYVGTKEQDKLTWLGVGATSVGLTGVALITYFTTTRLEDLAAYGRQPGAPRYLAQEWQNAANQEHAQRKVASWGLFALSGLSLGGELGILFSERGRINSYSVLLLATDAAAIVSGAYLASTEGPIESGLHAYECGNGQRSSAVRRVSRPSFAFAVTHGGAVGSLSMTF